MSELNTFGKKFNSLCESSGRLLVPSFKIEMKKSFDVITELQKTPWLATVFAEELNLYMDASKNKKLHISSIMHKPFVALNEKGIEASAATAVLATRGIAMTGKNDLYFDRPFYFIVQSGRTYEFGFSLSTILFMGKFNGI